MQTSGASMAETDRYQVQTHFLFESVTFCYKALKSELSAIKKSFKWRISIEQAYTDC
jgi:hypothetical protein